MKIKIKMFGLLHVNFLIYSMSSVFGKLAARQRFLSIRFCFCYLAVIVLFFFYAIVWQQVIKKIPLTIASASRSVTVVWGILWGKLLFHETITSGKLIGAILIIVGIVIFFDARDEVQI